ncbi:cobalt ECF transporter T component CbiQ [bacterium]|nr:cobalt ECF transporter T component CbiQ [bacterium]
MSCETFAEGRSFLHRADPRGKLLAAAAFAFTVALCDRFPVLWAALAFALVLLLCARLPLGKLLGRLAVVNVFIVILWLLLPLTGGGEKVYWGGPDLSLPGLQLAGRITLKANAIVCALIALATTSTVNALGRGLEGLRVPEKLVHLLLFTYRYIDVLAEERARLGTAMKARGFVPRLDRATLAAYGWLVGMLLVRGYDRSVRVHQAMLCRGFRQRFYTLTEFEWKTADSALVAAVLAATVLLGWMQWKGTPW